MPIETIETARTPYQQPNLRAVYEQQRTKEFASRAERQAYVDGLLEELDAARVRRPEDVEAVKAELGRLGVPRELWERSSTPATIEHEGEFATREQRAAYIEGLKAELRGAEQQSGDRERVADVKAELKRLSGPPAKTREELELSEDELEELEELEREGASAEDKEMKP